MECLAEHSETQNFREVICVEVIHIIRREFVYVSYYFMVQLRQIAFY